MRFPVDWSSQGTKVVTATIVLILGTHSVAQPPNLVQPPSVAQPQVAVEDIPWEDAGEEANQAEAVEMPANATTRMLRIIDSPDPNAQINAYYSPSLKGYFQIRRFRRGPTLFRAARLVSEPSFDSPLLQLGLRPGDIITRLDGLPVNSYYELDRHYADTNVRYIRRGSGVVRLGTIYIDAFDLNP